jgi:hypothetical protein
MKIYILKLILIIQYVYFRDVNCQIIKLFGKYHEYEFISKTVGLKGFMYSPFTWVYVRGLSVYPS